MDWTCLLGIQGLTCMLILSIFSAVLGMVQFGYGTGVMNVPQDIFKEFISQSYRNRTREYLTEDALDLIWSLTVAIFAIGGMAGGISGGIVANWCGRKSGLLLNNSLAMLGATFLSCAKQFDRFECLIFGRFFLGLNCGLNTALVPMYLSEIAPTNLRGALGTVSQLGVTVGLLLSQILGFPTILGTFDNWPFLLSIAFVPAILQLVLLPLCPESPRYLLLTKGRESEAKAALQRFRCMRDVSEDMDEMKLEQNRNAEKEFTMLELILARDLRMPLLIAIVMQLSQQLSGINAIFYYSTDVFKSAGLDGTQAKYATSAVGGVMVTMTLVSIPLMDRAGRRTLHLWGLGGMFLTSIFLTISMLVKFIYHGMAFVSVISVLLFTLFFAMGPGSIPWLITAELFAQGPRAAAISIAVLLNWFTNFIVGLVFPLLVRVFENYSFLPFTMFLAVFWTFTYHKVPETKNRSFDEIRNLFKQEQVSSQESPTPSISKPDEQIPPALPAQPPISSQPMITQPLPPGTEEAISFASKQQDPRIHLFHPHSAVAAQNLSVTPNPSGPLLAQSINQQNASLSHMNHFHCHFEPQFAPNVPQIPIPQPGIFSPNTPICNISGLKGTNTFKPKKKRSVAELDGESLLLSHMIENQL